VTLDVAQPSRSAGKGFALRRPQGVVPALAAFAPVVGLAGAQGGYFPSAWGWATLPLLWVAALALVLRERVRLSGSERTFLALLVALTVWILLSAAWSVAPAPSILESQRGLLYLAGVAAVLLVTRSRHIPSMLGGLLAAICAIAIFSLATRLLPDRVSVYDGTSVYRLAQPIGYWNGLAIFTGMGVLLALGFACRARTLFVRAAAAVAPMLLLPTFYFTFGRGAWIALGAGAAFAVAIDPRRLQLLAAWLALLPLPALAVWLASREPGLTHAGAPFSQAVHDGHRLALFLLLLAAGNAAVAVAFALLERGIEPSLWVRRAFAIGVVLVVVAGLMSIFVRYGGPTTLAQKGYHAFKAPPPHVRGNLNKRLLSFSGNGRADLWRLAWDDARAHSVLGAGAGTYERYFLAHQPANVGRVRDAHGLYVETLAELGPLGLIFLVGALVLPLSVLGPARRHPLVPAAAGAYAAYLVHAGVDWDWELPAVTLTGLLCGACLLIAARQSHRSPRLSSSARWVAVAALVAAAGFAAVGLVGNTALSRSNAARQDGNWALAARDARRAKTWMPWSPRPWVALGRAQLGAGLVSDARASFRKALSMDRGDWEPWYRLASASRGDTRRHALEQAARLFPRAESLRAAADEGRPTR
jgi:O-antigen ligase/polysaccharide polymerase Wzy-like membrane protein